MPTFKECKNNQISVRDENGLETVWNLGHPKRVKRAVKRATKLFGNPPKIN